MGLLAVAWPLNWGLGVKGLRTHVSLCLGGLLCGFVWELWNVYAYPQWVCDAPGVNFWHVFEMPLIGYIGYLPFALELHALVHLLFPWRPQLEL